MATMMRTASYRLSSTPVLKRQRTGSVICSSCGVLVGVNDETCYNCGRRNPGLWGYAPALRALGNDMGFVPFVIGTCVVLYVLTLALSGPNIGMGGIFNLLAPDGRILFLFGASGGIPTFGVGRWWTVLSAGWLHGSALHILFNLYWVRLLAPIVADRYGPGKMVIVYTAGSIFGFALSSFAFEYLPRLPVLSGGAMTLGASAPLFGLLGALVYYGRRGSSAVGQQALQYALFLGLFGLILGMARGGGIDNYAHLGGFAGGYLAGALLNPLKKEQIDHIAIAVVCLALSVLSVVASILHGLPLLPLLGF
jgi:rhomboid protease GluP